MSTIEFYKGKLYPMYNRPNGFNNIQWMQLVLRLLLGCSSLNIANDEVTEDVKELASKLSNETELSLELFTDMYERYTQSDKKVYDRIFYENPDAVGISMGQNGPELLYNKEGFRNGKTMSNGF